MRRSHFGEEEYQEEEEDLFNHLEEERQHCCEVERMRDQIEEVKGCALVSNMETEVSLASSPAKHSASRKEAGTKKKVLQENEWSVEILKRRR